MITWNVEAMFGSAGRIMSIANGFRAMIEAITRTNSGKPIGRWLAETKASALISVTRGTSGGNRTCIGHAALHNPSSEIAGALPAGPGHEDPLNGAWIQR